VLLGQKKVNLKDDKDYETGERVYLWDKFALSEINDQCYAVVVGKNEIFLASMLM
jgi:hypothetical protein